VPGQAGEAAEYEVHQIGVGMHEVTQGQWRAIMGNNPSYFSNCGDICPVEQVSWNDAKNFIRRLNSKTGKQYRLPSDAEWEYACRAGRQDYCGTSDSGWYGGLAKPAGNSGKSTTRSPNSPMRGLYDMSGNVWEWVEDVYHDSFKGAPQMATRGKGIALCMCPRRRLELCSACGQTRRKRVRFPLQHHRLAPRAEAAVKAAGARRAVPLLHD
jgi:formylglycine-generating enzyme required for sulfatase activity